MNKFMAVFFVVYAISLASLSMSNDDNKEAIEKIYNKTCHYCRKNIENYMDDDRLSCINKKCKKIFCKDCVEYTKNETKLTHYNCCPCCLSNCCCNFYLCFKEHEHCFTYKRTQKRHGEKKPVWIKRRKQPDNHWLFVYEDQNRPVKYIKKANRERYLSKKELKAIGALCMLPHALHD